MTDITTIFFDWGGVIAGDPADDFLNSLLRKIGASEVQVQEIYQTYMRRFMRGELSEAEYWDELRRNFNLTIHDTISDEFKSWNGLQQNNNILALVDEARSKGIKTAILSNVIEPTYNALFQTGHYEHFDEIIASCKVGFAKPQAEIYQLALNKLQTTPESSLFIDDKQANLDPAIAMGFHTILATDPEQIIRDVEHYLPSS